MQNTVGLSAVVHDSRGLCSSILTHVGRSIASTLSSSTLFQIAAAEMLGCRFQDAFHGIPEELSLGHSALHNSHPQSRKGGQQTGESVSGSRVETGMHPLQYAHPL